MQESFRAVEFEMRSEVEAGPEIYRPSRFWTRLNQLHDEQLANSGIERFKRTVNQSYFNWRLGIRDPQVLSLARWLVRHPHPAIVSARVEDWRGFETQDRTNPLSLRRRRWLYEMAVAALWEVARDRDRLGLLAELEEPELGLPVTVRYRGRRISQDLANSAMELYPIAEAQGSDRPGSAGVLELGAGYGRLAWLFLAAFPGLRYFIVDIPPALAIAQDYLTTLFPDRPTFRFRRFSDYRDVAAEIDAAQIGFLTPNQLEAAPAWHAGTFINISSLGEMRPDQIETYTALIGRHTDGIFYSKQWKVSPNPADGVTIAQSDYPVLPGWVQLYSRPHPIQTKFFEAAYRIGA